MPSGQLVEPATEDTATRGISSCIRNGRIAQLLWRTAVSLPSTASKYQATVKTLFILLGEWLTSLPRCLPED